jgi:hypothetical protein
MGFSIGQGVIVAMNRTCSSKAAGTANRDNKRGLQYEKQQKAG